MASRIKLHEQLIKVLGTTDVYYQAPENFKMTYPCIVYNQEPGDIKRANNTIYKYTKKYNVTCIFTTDNEDIILDMLTLFNNIRLDNTFVNDNLYHFIFTLYY